MQASLSLGSYVNDGIGIKATNPGDSKASKARGAATQFEAILIASLLEKFDSMAEIPGDTSSDAGGCTMHAIGVQALASKLAESGVLGIAKLVSEQLNPRTTNYHLGTKV